MWPDPSVRDLPVLAFPDAQAWEEWLAEHHADAAGVWLKLAKKDSGVPSVSYSAALDVAICFGWIDGQKDKYDEAFWLQRFSPRRNRSKWSAVNRAKALALIEAGRMHSAGQREVDAAQADGRWDAAYASQSKASVPDDLQAALDANPSARAFFEGLNSANRYAILYRIQNVKKAETRARKIAQFVEMLAAGRKIHE